MLGTTIVYYSGSRFISDLIDNIFSSLHTVLLSQITSTISCCILLYYKQLGNHVIPSCWQDTNDFATMSTS